MGMRTSDGHELLSEVMFQLSGLPQDVAQRALAYAVGEAAEACPLQPELYVPTQKNVAAYPFEQLLPPGYDVLGVSFVKYCGRCLDPIDKCDPCPHGYFLDDLGHLTLFPAAHRDADKDLELCVTVRPELSACEYPHDLLTRCRDELLHAMKGYLMQMPDKQWSNTQLAAFHLQKSAAGFQSLAAAVSRQFTKQTTITSGESWLI